MDPLGRRNTHGRADDPPQRARLAIRSRLATSSSRSETLVTAPLKSRAARHAYSSSRPSSPRHFRPAEAAPPKRRGFLAGGRIRAILLLAVLTIASSSRGDVGAFVPDGPALPASVGLQAWSASVAYSTGDLVEYGGALYKAKAPNSNSPPSTSSAMWMLFDPGSGVPGAAGDLSTVTPTFACLVPDTNTLAATSFTAVFGYTNSSNTTVIAPINATAGTEQNAFVGPAPAQGQPIAFAPGARRRVRRRLHHVRRHHRR
jgi:hypothetical protein